MPSKKSTKVLLACLDPHLVESLGLFLVDHHQLGPVVAAERVSGGVANPTFGADLVGIESEGRPGRACSSIEPVWHQIIGIFGAEARIEGIAASARRADHTLRKRAFGAPVGQFRAIADAESILRRELRKAHRAASSPRRAPARLAWPPPKVASLQRGAAGRKLNRQSRFLHACAAAPTLRAPQAPCRVSPEQRETTPSLNCDGSPRLRATKKPGSLDSRAARAGFPDYLALGLRASSRLP